MKLLLICLFIGTLFFCNAQVEVIENGNVEVGVNTVDGEEQLNVYGTSYFSDNVGIGIKDPQFELQVKGGASILDVWGSTNINSKPGLGGWHNVFVGQNAGNSAVSGGNNNVGVGLNAGYSCQSCQNNVFVGRSSGYNNVYGNNNVFVGINSGLNATGSNCVYLGANSGYYNVTDNRLFISSSGTHTTPLIYGEFDNRTLFVRSGLEIQHQSDPGQLFLPYLKFNGNQSRWTMENEDFYLNIQYDAVNPLNSEKGELRVESKMQVDKKMTLKDIMVMTPQSNIPSSPVVGTIYMDDGTNTSGVMTIRFYNGTGWVNLN